MNQIITNTYTTTQKKVRILWTTVCLFLLSSSTVLFSNPPHSTKPLKKHDKETQIGRPLHDSNLNLDSLACSALGLLFKENDNQIPTSLKELVSILEKQGKPGSEIQRLIIPFSQSPFTTSLERPRLLFHVRQRQSSEIKDPKKSRPFLELEKKLFMAVTFNADASQTLEFLSWNYQKETFDFGIIENFNRPSKRKLISSPEQTRQCLSCHKTGGPILSIAPWSNTTNGHGATEIAFVQKQAERDPTNYSAVQKEIARLREESKIKPLSPRVQNLLEGGLIPHHRVQEAQFKEFLNKSEVIQQAKLSIDGEDTGLKLFDTTGIHITDFDNTVRDTSQLLLFSQSLQALPLHERREIIQAGLKALISQFISSKHQEEMTLSYHQSLSFLEKATTNSLASKASDTLRDRSPSTGRSLSPDSFSEEQNSLNERSVETILAYNAKRQLKKETFPKEFLPSSPSAFIENEPPTSTMFVDRFNIGEFPEFGLGGVMGLTREDKEYIVKNTPRAATPSITTEMEQRILNSQPILALLNGTRFPSRTQFMTRLKKALDDERKRENKVLFPLSSDYEQTFAVPLPCEETIEAPVEKLNTSPLSPLMKSHCLSCHRGENGAIQLPFDPENKNAWEERLRSENPAIRRAAQKLRKKVLERLTEKTAPMPPLDSKEAEQFELEEKKALINFLKSL